VRFVRLLPALFLAGALAGNASARPKPKKRLRESVTKCPKHTTPVRTVDPREPWACALKDEKYRDGIECPRGSRSITTSNTFDPFKCALTGIRVIPPRGICPPGERAIPTSDPEKDYECEKLGKGFKGGPRCPSGTRPVPTPDAIQPFTCIARNFKPEPTEPTLTPAFADAAEAGKKTRKRAKKNRRSKKTKRNKRCPKGTRRIETGDPFEPERCVRSDRARPARLRYTGYRIGGELSFRYPRDWSINDAWRQVPPSVHIMPEEARDGRPVTLTIAYEKPGNPDFVDLKTRAWQEKDWHGAEERGTRNVAGREAVLLGVAGQSAMALVPSGQGYYVLSYSAPADLYHYYEPAYKTLLRSFKPLTMKRNP
jgi:hypothetical protein